MGSKKRLVLQITLVAATIAANLALFSSPAHADDLEGSCYTDGQKCYCIAPPSFFPYCFSAQDCQDIFTTECGK